MLNEALHVCSLQGPAPILWLVWSESLLREEGESSVCLPPLLSSRLPSLTGPERRQLGSQGPRSHRREFSLWHH